MMDLSPAIRGLSVSMSLSAGPVREAIEQSVTGRGVPTFEWPSAIGVTVPWRAALTDEIPVTVL
jgi:hypothetical protein